MLQRSLFAVALFVGVTFGGTPLAAQAATAPGAPATAPEPVVKMENRQMPLPELLPLLDKGGLVLLMRHERTEVPSLGDRSFDPPNDCTKQRNLSVAGVAGAAETGVAIRALGWPIGKVLSSPMCRATETARYIFGRYEIEPRLLHHDNTPERTVTVSGKELNDVLASLPSGRSDNTVLVSHIGNIYFAIGLTLSEGEFGILQRQADGRYAILNTIDPGDIGAMARSAIYQASLAKAAKTK